MKWFHEEKGLKILAITGTQTCWIKVLIDLDDSIVSIRIVRTNDSDDEDSLVAKKIKSDDVYVDDSLEPGTAYSYIIDVETATFNRVAKLSVRSEPNDRKEELQFFSNYGTWAKNDVPKLARESAVSLENPYYKKMSHGLMEAMIAFIREAKDEHYALKIAAYQFDCALIATELKKAKARKVDIQIFSRLKIMVKSKKGADTIEIFDKTMEQYGLTDCVIRGEKYSGIFHNKFMVLLYSKDGREPEPRMLFTGTANFTDSGFFQQYNYAFVISNREIVDKYNDYWDFLIKHHVPKGRKQAKKSTKPKNFKELLTDFGEYSSIVDVPEDKAIDLAEGSAAVFFSPQLPITRKSGPYFIQMQMEKSKSFNCISLPFKLSTGAPELVEYILQEKKKPLYLLFNKLADDDPFTKTSSNIVSFGRKLENQIDPGLSSRVRFIHAKMVLFDPLLTNCKMLCGSGNFGKTSFTTNDENFIVIEGNSRMACIMFADYMRLHHHYKTNRPNYMQKLDDPEFYLENRNLVEHRLFDYLFTIKKLK